MSVRMDGRINIFVVLRYIRRSAPVFHIRTRLTDAVFLLYDCVNVTGSTRVEYTKAL